jgi:hypothetical protein
VPYIRSYLALVMSTEKSGCFFILFHLLVWLPKHATNVADDAAELVELPYRVRDDFLSPRLAQGVDHPGRPIGVITIGGKN